MNSDEPRDPTMPEAAEPEAAMPESAEAPAPEPAPETVEMALAPATEAAEAPIEQEPEAIAQAVAAAIPAEQVDAALAAIEPEPAPEEETYDLPQALFDAGFDVEAALGALSFEHEDEAGHDGPPPALRLPPFTPSNYQPRLPVPPLLRVRRGQPGSLIPALTLIGVGAWLTVAQVTNTAIDPSLVSAVLAGGLLLTFVAVWLGSGRWPRGLLLAVLVALIGAGGGALILGAGLGNALSAYPLLLSALGVAILLTAFLARPLDRPLLGPALVFITAGIVGYLVLNGAIPAGLLSGAAAYWFVPAIILLILIALPLFVRRRA